MPFEFDRFSPRVDNSLPLPGRAFAAVGNLIFRVLPASCPVENIGAIHAERDTLDAQITDALGRISPTTALLPEQE